MSALKWLNNKIKYCILQFEKIIKMKTNKFSYFFTFIIILASCNKPQFKGTIYCRIGNDNRVKTNYEYYKISNFRY